MLPTIEQYVTRAREIAAPGCVCLTFDLRGQARHAAQRLEVTREDNLRDVLAAYDALGSRPSVDPRAVVIVGSNYGGYLAALVAPCGRCVGSHCVRRRCTATANGTRPRAS